jgi:AcrR family transcriptional regulator
MELIAEKVDITRTTLYTYFKNKTEIIESIIKPVMEEALQKISQIDSKNSKNAVRELLALYFDLYSKFPSEMKLSYRVQHIKMDQLIQLHMEFINLVINIFNETNREGILRCEDSIKGARLLSSVGVPTMEILEKNEQAKKLFIQSMEAFLLK